MSLNLFLLTYARDAKTFAVGVACAPIEHVPSLYKLYKWAVLFFFARAELAARDVAIHDILASIVIMSLALHLINGRQPWAPKVKGPRASGVRMDRGWPRWDAQWLVLCMACGRTMLQASARDWGE